MPGDAFLQLMDILEKHRISISIAVITTIVVLLLIMPMYFGLLFLITASIFLIATFNPMHIRRSLTRFIIFLFLLGLFSSPILVSFAMETYKINNPETIIDLNHPKIIEMTEEFQNRYEYDEEDYEKILAELRDYVYEKIPYGTGHPYVFPSTQDVFSGKNSDCRARALIGFSILKNMGYDAYIVCDVVNDVHAWIRIFREDGTYIDGFDWRDKRPDFEPFVVFNENEASWSNPLGQISGILFHGFYSVMISNLVNWVTLIFFLPVSAVAIFLLLIYRTYRTRNIIPYLLVIGLSALLPLFLSNLVI